MTSNKRWALAGAMGVAMLASAVVVHTSTAAQSAGSTASGGLRFRPMVVTVGKVHSPTPPTEQQCLARFHFPCYSPDQIETAYNVQPLFRQGVNGSGETIVIVDSFGSPTIVPDLAYFDRSFGLPTPPSLRILTPEGAVHFNPATTTELGWAGETTLDVEYSHAMAPGANILLVETPTAETEGVTGFPTIMAAESYVIDHHLGDVISQSFGATEETFTSPQTILKLRSAYESAYTQGVTVLAAAGDTGATTFTVTEQHHYPYRVVSWPPSDPLVTAVGGTKLTLDTSGQRLVPDVVWNDTYNHYVVGTTPSPSAGGGGLSSVFSRPSYQNGVADVVGNRRGIPDISMSAACSGAVLIYQSVDGKTAAWTVTCGTSEATPLFAGIVALSDQVAHHSLGLINPALYAMSAEHAQGLVDVTQGDNTVSFTTAGHIVTVPGYSAGPGYDLASGVGTVNAALFVPELVQAVATASTGPFAYRGTAP